jgi:hypothetical protein
MVAELVLLLFTQYYANEKNVTRVQVKGNFLR